MEQPCRKGPEGAGDGRLSVSSQQVLAAWRANNIVGCVKHSTDSWSKEVIFLLFLALVQPHPEYCIQFWALKYTKGIKFLECVQGRATKLVKLFL